jgi:hypothetical protein
MNKRWTCLTGVASVVLAVMAARWLTVRYQLHHIEAQPADTTTTEQDRYFYGSVGAGKTAGIPYWIWLALPRLFPDLVKVPGGHPAPGGYAVLGMEWQEGREMPIGFAKQRVGYIRVTGNCALCHFATKKDIKPIEPLVTFLKECAADPRYNAGEFFNEVDSDTSLSLWDKALYRFVLIPATRRALLKDPEKVLFSPAIRAHIADPHSSAPFAQPEMRTLLPMVLTGP